jgi:hypothetical protein
MGFEEAKSVPSSSFTYNNKPQQPVEATKPVAPQQAAPAT